MAESVHEYSKDTIYLDLQSQNQKETWGPPASVAKLSWAERAIAERNLKRKLDTRILPALVAMYVLNYLDRNSIASTRLGGIADDIPLAGNDFQISVSILFIGYILMQVPSNLFLDSVKKPALYLPTCMVVWGAICASTGAVKTYPGLLLVRFFLGFVEAAFFPGCLFFLSSWYTRKELGLRTAILYSGSLVSGAFSGLIAAGIVNGLDKVHGLRAWRWMFIIEGTMTVGVALIAFFILPNFPGTTKWLTLEERELAIWRLTEDAAEVDEDKRSVFWGFKLALKDVRVYILMLMITCIVSASGVTNFFPTVVATLHKSPVVTLLLTVPPYVFGIMTLLFNAFHADRTGERFFHITIPLCVGVAAYILAATTTSFAPRYLAMMLMPAGTYTGYVVCLAWISNTLPRPPAKRAAALAMINSVSNMSSIYASFMYQDSAAPRFVAAMVVNAATLLLAMACALTLKIMLTKLNHRLSIGREVDDLILPTGYESFAGQDSEKERMRRGFKYLV